MEFLPRFTSFELVPNAKPGQLLFWVILIWCCRQTGVSCNRAFYSLHFPAA